jgi:hypothetical protein
MLEAVKDERTVRDLSLSRALEPTIINRWKHALVAGAAHIFTSGGKEARELDWATVMLLNSRFKGWLLLIFCSKT